jgi:hypothetical protein
MNQDNEQIKILSIFHYVVAGLAALIACIPIVHLTIGISILTGGFFAKDFTAGDSTFPVNFFGMLFTIIPLIIILSGWAFAICLAVAGNFLSKQKHYLFCLIMAGIACVFTPFGTVLGIFTIMVLTRPSVKALFNPQQP